MDNQACWGSLRRAVALLLATSATSFSASDTWSQPGGTHEWTDPANWVSGVQYPNGSGDVASFTNDITATQGVGITQTVTVGTINIGDSAAALNSFYLGASIAQTINLDNGASPVTINNTAGYNVILAGLSATGANKDLVVNVDGIELDFGSPSHDSTLSIRNLTKNGAGTLFMWNNNSGFTGSNITINAGNVFLDSMALPTNGVVTLGSGAVLGVGGGRSQRVAEIRGVGVFRGPSNGQLIVGDNVARTGETIANNGVLRPGDTNGPNQVGTLSIGFVGGGGEAAAPQFDPGSKMYFDIAGYTSFDRIDIPRVFTVIEGGDIYINFLGGFVPTNGTRFSLFIDSSTQGYRDGNGGDIFDNVTVLAGGDPLLSFEAQFAGPTVDGEDPLGLGRQRIDFLYVPEPSATAMVLLAGAAMILRQRGRLQGRVGK